MGKNSREETAHKEGPRTFAALPHSFRRVAPNGAAIKGEARSQDPCDFFVFVNDNIVHLRAWQARGGGGREGVANQAGVSLCEPKIPRSTMQRGFSTVGAEIEGHVRSGNGQRCNGMTSPYGQYT